MIVSDRKFRLSFIVTFEIDRRGNDLYNDKKCRCVLKRNHRFIVFEIHNEVIFCRLSLLVIFKCKDCDL